MAFDLPSDDDSDNRPMALVLYLQGKSSNFTDSIEDDNWEEQAANRLTDAMQSLDERSQDIIHARWLDGDNKSTLQELADRYGVFVECIRQLEKNMMKKLCAVIGMQFPLLNREFWMGVWNFYFLGLCNNQFPLRRSASPCADC